MSFDEGLAQRVREQFAERSDVVEKRMFGGLCFMVSSHMCCGIVDSTLMLRVGPDQYESLLREKHAREMDFTGKAMKGMLYIDPEGISEELELSQWLGYAIDFVESLPPKKSI